MISKAILSDSIYEKWGLEEEELQAAVVYYQLMSDPDVVRAVKK